MKNKTINYADLEFKDNNYLIIGNTTPGIKLQDTIEAKNISDAISIFVTTMDIEPEGNVNFPFSFTIIKLKELK